MGFNTELSADVYAVEATEIVTPVGEGAHTILLYDTDTSAAVAYAGTHRTIIVGFPFETITNANERNRMMAKCLDYLLLEHKSFDTIESEPESGKRTKKTKR